MRVGLNKTLTLAASMAALLLPMAAGAYEWNMPRGVTDISREVFDLHMLIFWIVTIIGIGVFGVMFYSVFAHRKSKGAKAADFHESTTVEIIWTVIPFIILIAMAIPAAGTLIKMEDTTGSEMTVKVTGYQWMWQYDYLDSGIKIYSRLHPDHDKARQLDSGVDVNTIDNYLVEVDNRLVLPVDTKIRFLLTSNDVLHAWWVPDFAIKKDAVPGFVREIWTKVDEPGVYRGRCAELCGRDHGFMPIVVEVLPKDEYAAWVASNADPDTMSDAMIDAPMDAEAVIDAAAGTAPPPRQTVETPAFADPAGPNATLVAAATEAASAQAQENTGDSGQTDSDAAPTKPATATASASSEADKSALMSAGKKVYGTNCAACHQGDGTGLSAAGFPSLHGSAIVAGPADAQIMQVLKGKNAMPPFAYLSDAQIAAVITYTRNSWGNDTGVVTADQVAAQR